jgi:hypothetical protein
MDNEGKVIKHTKSPKNSLIELLRFVMASSVLIFHGFMPVKTTILDMGVTCVSVDFFLMLGGFLFASSFARVSEESTFKGFLFFLARRLKRLGLPFLVSLLFAIYNTITMRHIGWLFGYLWFIPVEIIAQIVLFFLLKLIKRKKILIPILLVTAVVGYSYFYALPPDFVPYAQGGYNIYFSNLWSILGYPLRGLGGVFVGYCLTLVPKLKTAALRPIFAIASFAMVLTISFLPFFIYKEQILLVLFALSIYFLFQINFSFVAFDYLGALAFGLYIFQTLGSTLRANNLATPEVVLLIIIAASVLSAPEAFSQLFANKKRRTGVL